MRVLAVFGVVLVLLSACGSDTGQRHKGELGDACDSQKACQDHLKCEAGFCVDPKETTTTPACGSNSRSFAYDEQAWPSEDFCLRGSLVDESVLFPEPGDEVSWWCQDLDSNLKLRCSAERALAPVEVVDGLCGENAQDFMREEVSWLSEEFCSRGELEGATPDFPGLGEHVTWHCLGEEGGADVMCRADRLEVCSPERQEPAGWVRKTARCAYSTSAGWLPSCLAWNDIWPMPFHQVGGVTYRLMVDSEVDNYIALEFDTFEMSSSDSGRLSSAPPGVSIGHYRWRILTISRCPGDFYQEAIEEETGCYFNLTGTSPNIAWGGPDTDRNCRLEPNEVYYLNIIHTYDPAGTHPDDLQSNCDMDLCGAVYDMQQD